MRGKDMPIQIEEKKSQKSMSSLLFLFADSCNENIFVFLFSSHDFKVIRFNKNLLFKGIMVFFLILKNFFNYFNLIFFFCLIQIIIQLFNSKLQEQVFNKLTAFNY